MLSNINGYSQKLSVKEQVDSSSERGNKCKKTDPGKWRLSRFHAQMWHIVQAFINTYAWMYPCLCLATIKEHLNGKEKYRLTRADGGFGELPGCSLSICSGGLGARTGVPKRDVQTHKKEGNQSGCAHGGACVCVMVKTQLQARHNSLFTVCHSPAPSRSLMYKSKSVAVWHAHRKEGEMSLLITKSMNLNRILPLFWGILFAENLLSRMLQRDQMTNAGRRSLVFCSFLFLTWTEYCFWKIGRL